MELRQAMEDRRSCRAFASTPVERKLIAEVLRSAARAPSALNLQPWEVTVVTGEELKRLTRKLLRAYRERSTACTPGASRPLPQQFQRRRKKSFDPLAELLAQQGMDLDIFIGEGSCGFYGAPAALIICMDGAFSKDRLICIGAFLGYLVLAAHEAGLATCPMTLIASYQDEIRDQLNLSEDKEVVLGVALGYAEAATTLAAFATPRDPTEQYVRWYP